MFDKPVRVGEGLEHPANLRQAGRRLLCCRFPQGEGRDVLFVVRVIHRLCMKSLILAPGHFFILVLVLVLLLAPFLIRHFQLLLLCVILAPGHFFVLVLVLVLLLAPFLVRHFQLLLLCVILAPGHLFFLVLVLVLLLAPFLVRHFQLLLLCQKATRKLRWCSVGRPAGEPAVEEPRFKDAEELRFGQAEGRIAIERHIAKQQFLIDRLRAAGRDTKDAEEVLRDYQDNLKMLCEIRQLIVKTIEQIDQGHV